MNVVTGDPRTAIKDVAVEGRRVRIHWGDGHKSRFHAIWLRHNCHCPACGTSETAIKPLKLTDIPADIAARSATLEASGDLVIVWEGDGHETRYAPAWLRAHCYSDAERSRRHWRATLWGPEIASALPQADFGAAKADEHARLDLLEKLRDYGFVLVRGVPAEPEATPEIAELAGPLRITNYGSVYDFRYSPKPLVYGDSEVGLNPHTDEPYRQSPPSVTVFHFVRAAERGGESVLVDAFRIGEELRAADPAAFELLAHERATFHRRLYEQGRDFRMRAPVFSLDETGAIAGFRLLDRGVGPLDLAEDKVEPYFAALRKLLAMLYDEANQLRVPVAAGEALFFNNQRVLHGRTAFDPGSARFMRTCHVELDEFYSTLRILAARLGRDGADLDLPAGALV
jgi:alpha-ketoglutarate-dependent taurine dioxygenase